MRICVKTAFQLDASTNACITSEILFLHKFSFPMNNPVKKNAFWICHMCIYVKIAFLEDNITQDWIHPNLPTLLQIAFIRVYVLTAWMALVYYLRFWTFISVLVFQLMAHETCDLLTLKDMGGGWFNPLLGRSPAISHRIILWSQNFLTLSINNLSTR